MGKYKEYEGTIGFIPDSCRECKSFVLNNPCACPHDCERNDPVK